jgi:dipeptidase
MLITEPGWNLFHRKSIKQILHTRYIGELCTRTLLGVKMEVELKGENPLPSKTFAYLNTAYPCLNEKQLAIGETTIRGRKELKNENGLFLIEELERVALQRCTTARQAIN